MQLRLRAKAVQQAGARRLLLNQAFLKMDHGSKGFLDETDFRPLAGLTGSLETVISFFSLVEASSILIPPKNEL